MKIAKRIRKDIELLVTPDMYDGEHFTDLGAVVVDTIITEALAPTRLTIEEIEEEYLWEFSMSIVEKLDEIIEELS